MLDLIDSILSMKLDVYRQSDDQDPDTGALKKSWMYYKTMDCHVKGTISNSATTRSSDRQTIGAKYLNEQTIQIRTTQRLVTREKITNIRDSANKVIWTELNYPTETPTVFEVVGTTPITDPFGNIVGYNTMAARSENQQIGI